MLQNPSQELILLLTCSLMATLSHFPTFSPSSHKLFAYHLPSLNLDHHFHIFYHNRHPTICASSINKPRATRKTKSNAELCNELREFLTTVGLPEDHVPSMKELSQHGRQELANIVRRRGYKLVRELLATSRKTKTVGSDIGECSTERQDAASATEDILAGQNQKVKDLVVDVSFPSETPVMEDDLSSTNVGSDLNSNEKSGIVLEFSSNSSLQEKVANFIQNGELDTVEDSGLDILNGSDAEDDQGFIESQNAIELELSSFGEEPDKTVNGSSKLSSQWIASPSERGIQRNDRFSAEGPLSADSNKDLDIETANEENEVEIDRLNFMLHQKELELSQLKQQIEKEKLALSSLQTKAETEINNAQNLILEKDAELHATEESLFGLEEVEIQYWGDGETVEVAGSFNGWHHQIKMDPQPSSSIIDPTGSRKSRLWKTVLWLYPGIYEIKFIVDGQWMIDPQRESVTRGTIHNNILRVDT